jgi:hypothetical protein
MKRLKFKFGMPPANYGESVVANQFIRGVYQISKVKVEHVYVEANVVNYILSEETTYENAMDLKTKLTKHFESHQLDDKYDMPEVSECEYEPLDHPHTQFCSVCMGLICEDAYKFTCAKCVKGHRECIEKASGKPFDEVTKNIPLDLSDNICRACESKIEGENHHCSKPEKSQDWLDFMAELELPIEERTKIIKDRLDK